MSTVKITCNCNFKKVEDVSENVKKVFKMFEEYLIHEESPINKDSEIECVYTYGNLTVDNLRVFKKIADNNKSMLNLSDITILEESDGITEDKVVVDDDTGSLSDGSDNVDDVKEHESLSGDDKCSVKINYESSDDEKEDKKDKEEDKEDGEKEDLRVILNDIKIATKKLEDYLKS